MSDELGYDESTALIVVDMQNDFAHPDGNLYVAGGEQTIPFINEQVAHARDAGAVVVYTQDWHPASTPHFAKDGGAWPVHCVMDTWGAELHPDLDAGEPVVRKGSGGEDGYSGFMMRDPGTGEEQPTELDGILVRHTVGRVVVVGLAQDVCVKATAVDAATRGYEVDVPAAGTRPVNLQEGDDQRAWDTMRQAGCNVA
ncbi:MAG: isochorismatase family protein [Streptosporangiales bacterium]